MADIDGILLIPVKIVEKGVPGGGLIILLIIIVIFMRLCSPKQTQINVTENVPDQRSKTTSNSISGVEYYEEQISGFFGTRFINHNSYGVHVRLYCDTQPVAFWLEPEDDWWLNATIFRIAGVYKTVSYDW
jgi:hypothetical protein